MEATEEVAIVVGAADIKPLPSNIMFKYGERSLTGIDRFSFLLLLTITLLGEIARKQERLCRLQSICAPQQNYSARSLLLWSNNDKTPKQHRKRDS